MITMYLAHNSAVLRTLPQTGSLNRRICGSAFGYAQTCSTNAPQTSHIHKMLDEMVVE